MPLIAFTLGSKIVIALPDEIDISNSDAVRDELVRTVDDVSATPMRELVADLSRARFITAAGLRAVLDAHYHAVGRGVTLRVAAPSRLVRRAFQITDLDALIPIHYNLADALAAPPIRPHGDPSPPWPAWARSS